jgi:hypothetical protein
MASPLEEEIARLQHGHHVCCYYDSPAHQMAIAIAYIKTGLARAEQCLYIADELTLRAVAAVLAQTGVDVRGEQERNALVLLTPADAYLRNGGVFAADWMLRFLADGLDQALIDGFSGLRAGGDMSWIHEDVPGADEAPEYEARLNQFFPGRPALGLCLYHRARTSAAIRNSALGTHPHVVLRDRLRASPYYQAAAAVPDRPAPSGR